MKKTNGLLIALLPLLVLSGCLSQGEGDAVAQSVALATASIVPDTTSVDTVFGQIKKIHAKDDDAPKGTPTVFELVYYTSRQDSVGTTLKLKTTKPTQKVQAMYFYLITYSTRNGECLVDSMEKCYPRFAVAKDSARSKTVWLYTYATGREYVARVFNE